MEEFHIWREGRFDKIGESRNPGRSESPRERESNAGFHKMPLCVGSVTAIGYVTIPGGLSNPFSPAPQTTDGVIASPHHGTERPRRACKRENRPRAWVAGYAAVTAPQPAVQVLAPEEPPHSHYRPWAFIIKPRSPEYRFGLALKSVHTKNGVSSHGRGSSTNSRLPYDLSMYKGRRLVPL